MSLLLTFGDLKDIIIIVKYIHYEQKGKIGVTMKKIICLLVALVMMFAMVSCGEQCAENCVDENEDGKCDVCGFDYENPGVAILKMVAEANPTSIKTVTGVSSDGAGYTGVYETTIYSANHFVYEYEYERAKSPFEEGDEAVAVEKGELVYKDGSYVLNGVAVSGAPDVAYLDIKSEINAENIGKYTVDKTGRVLTATLTSEACQKIFGINPGAENVTLTLKTDGIRLAQIDITYTNAANVVVSIQTSYSYAAVSPEA